MSKEYLFCGMPIYHLNQRGKKTDAKVNAIEDNDLEIEFSEPIDYKKVVKLPKSHLGEWLFYAESDMELTPIELMALPQYFNYKNSKIMKAYQEEECRKEEEKKRLEKEEKMRLEEEKKKLEKLEYENRLKVDAEFRKEEERKRTVEGKKTSLKI